MGKKGTTNLTEDDFTQIKILLGTGLSKAMVGTVTKRSSSTISRIAKYDTLKEYRADQLAERNRYKTKRAPETEGVGTAVPRTMEDSIPQEVHVVSKTKSTTDEQLTRIADALEALVDAWNTKPDKKGWLK